MTPNGFLGNQEAAPATSAQPPLLPLLLLTLSLKASGQQKTYRSDCLGSGGPAAAEARLSLRSPHPGARVSGNSLNREVLVPGPSRLSDPARFCADSGQESRESLWMAASSHVKGNGGPRAGSDSPSTHGDDLSRAGPGPGLPDPRPGPPPQL